MNKLLAWRYPPYPGQDFQDYINVLAEKNGYFNKSLFKRAFNLPNGSGEWNIHTATGKVVLATIAEYTGLDSTAMASAMSMDLPHTSPNYHVGQRRLEHHHPRICPDCIAEQPYIRNSWRYTPNTHCMVHHRLLEDTCPKCHKVMSWTAEHRLCCCCDNLTIKFPAPIESESILPNYVVTGRQERLHQVIDRIARPLDALAGSTSLSHMKNKDLAFMYKIAFSYSTSEQFRNSFDNECIKRRMEIYGCERKSNLYFSKWKGIQKYSYEVNDERSEHLVGGYIDRLYSISGNPNEFGLFVSARRLKDKPRITNLDLVNQTDAFQTAQYLGIPKPYLRKLIDSQIVSQWCDYKTTRDALFDINSINLCLDVKIIKKTKNHIGFSEIIGANYLKLFRSEISILIGGIAERKVGIYSDISPAPLGRIFFLRRDINSLLEKNLTEVQSDISIADLAGFYNVEKHTILNLIRNGNLVTTTPNSTDSSERIAVKHSSFAAFNQEYICINRIAKLIRKRVDRTQRILEEEGIIPCISHGKDIFYKRTISLDYFIEKMMN